MRGVPKVTYTPGAVDVKTLRDLGAAPSDPAFDSFMQPPDPGRQVERANEAGDLAQYRAANLADRIALVAQDRASIERMVAEELPGVLEPIKNQFASLSALRPTGPLPENALGIDVEQRVAAFRDQIETARMQYEQAAAGATGQAMEQQMAAAAAQMQMAMLDAAGAVIQNQTGYNPVQLGKGALALTADDLSASGGLSALSAIAGALPGGAEAAEALALSAKAIAIAEKVDFGSLLSGGPPDLAAVASALDAMQDFAMGALMDALPPGAQQAIQAAQTIMAAYGINMPSLSELASLKESPPSSPKTPGCYIENEFVATILSPTTHGSPTLPGPGAPLVLYHFMPVWRAFLDFHACPVVKGVVPDVGGVVMKAAVKTIVMGSFGARKGDIVTEIPGGPNPIIKGPSSSHQDQDEGESTSPDKPQTEDPESVDSESQSEPDGSPTEGDSDEPMESKAPEEFDDRSAESPQAEGGPPEDSAGSPDKPKEEKSPWGKPPMDVERHRDFDGTADDLNKKTAVGIGGSYQWGEGGDQMYGSDSAKLGYYDYEASSGYNYDPQKNQHSASLIEGKAGIGVFKGEGEAPIYDGRNASFGLTGGASVAAGEVSAKVGAGWEDEFKGAEASAGASFDLVKVEGGAKAGIRIPFTEHKITFGVSSSVSVGAGAEAGFKAGYSADEGFQMKGGGKASLGVGLGLSFSIGFK